MKKFIQPGKNLELTAPSTIVSGQPLQIGKLNLVACAAIVNGEKGNFSNEGVFELTKLTGAGKLFAEGALVYFNAGNMDIAGVGTVFGIAVEAAIITDTTVKVKLIYS